MLMSGRVLGFAAVFLIPLILVRIFSPAEFGAYRQLFLIANPLFTIVQLGFVENLFYFLPANSSRAGRCLFNSIVVAGAIGLIGVAVLSVASGAIAGWFGNADFSRYSPLIGAYLLFSFVGVTLETTLLCRKRHLAATATYALSDILRGALLIVPALVWHSLEAALYGAVAFGFVRMTASCVYAAREFGSELALDYQLLRQQLIYSAPLALAVLVEMLQENYHQFAVASRFDVATFALYSVGCLQIPLVDFLAGPACNIMIVRMREESSRGRTDEVLEIWRDTSRKLALFFFPLVGLLLANAHPLITLLFTERYAGAVPLFQIFSLTIIGSAFQVNGALRVFAETRFLLVVNVLRLLAIVMLTNWFISASGLTGPVLLTVLAVFFAKAAALLRLRTLLGTSIAEILPWRELGGILIMSIVAAVPAALLTVTLQFPALLILPISGVVFLATYGGLLLVFGRQIVRVNILQTLSQRIRGLKPQRVNPVN
jgi:O-antigen/teichoic acid export membrane protein